MLAMTATTTDQSDVTEEATRRFRVAQFIQRNGSRAQKRVIMTGKAAKGVSKNVLVGVKNQIVEPYSATKQVLVGIGLIGVGVAMWYLTALVCLAIAGGTGSWILAIVGAVAFYMTFARFIYLPLMLGASTYYRNAAMGSVTMDLRTSATRGRPVYAS